jgi:hypothetical protein
VVGVVENDDDDDDDEPKADLFLLREKLKGKRRVVSVGLGEKMKRAQERTLRERKKDAAMDRTIQLEISWPCSHHRYTLSALL